VGRAAIFGVIGVVPSAEVKILPWNGTIVEGRFLSDSDDDGVLISAKLKERLNTTVGASLTLNNWKLRLNVVGVFDDEKVESLRDLDGQLYLPQKIIVIDRIVVEHVEIVKIGLASCSANETLVVTWRTASKLGFCGVYISRLDVVLQDETKLKEYAKEIALDKGLRAWASTEEGTYLAELAPYFEGKDLPIAVPWAIVILNVVIAMLNSLYERRREIFVYSAIGMNPSHITGLFLVEAAMIGVIGGGMGYLLGLGWYRVMAFFTLALQVKQKVSAIWVLGAIAIAMASVLAGGYIAIRGSVVITPSLRRRWSAGKKLSALTQPLELTLPITVMEEEVEGFVEYVANNLRSRKDDIEYVVRRKGVATEDKEKETEREEVPLRTISFFYRPGGPGPSTIHSSNKVILRREKGSEVYAVKLLSQGDPKAVQRVTSILRQIIMEWSMERGKREEAK
jgi:hypothetical protein